MFQLSYMNLTTGFWTFVYVWMISRGGLAFLFVPINVVAFSFVPKERMNSATGLINLARNIGGSVGISMVTTIQARLAQKHQTRPDRKSDARLIRVTLRRCTVSLPGFRKRDRAPVPLRNRPARSSMENSRGRPRCWRSSTCSGSLAWCAWR